MPLKTIDALAMCFTLLVFQFISFKGQAQCNTTLNKLLPEASVNNDDWFGGSMAANGQYMVVGAETSDTLGIYRGGAAYVYEKTVAGWAYRAMLTPSDSEENDFFGNKVAIDASGNTIVVIDRDYSNGGAYIFEKPASGWQTMQETANIKFPGYLEFNSALDISDDGSTIVVPIRWPPMSCCIFSGNLPADGPVPRHPRHWRRVPPTVAYFWYLQYITCDRQKEAKYTLIGISLTWASCDF